MKRIIVPTNFTETAWNAAKHALEYANILDAEVILLNTFDEIYAGEIKMISLKDELKSTSLKKLDTLSTELKKLDAAREIKIRTVSLYGNLSKILKSYVSTSGNDIIVLGTKSKKRLAGRLFGDKVSKIVENIVCPILVIPPHYNFSLSNGIACAISEFGEIDDMDVLTLTEIVANYYDPVLKLLHITTEKEAYKETLVLPFSEFDSLETDYVDLIGDNIPRMLENYTIQEELNCLVLLKKDRSFMEKLFHKSISSEVVSHAHIPLLILRST
jgi:nucleotide-binding universal stress UspA family protein